MADEGVPLEIRGGRIRARLDPDADQRDPWFEAPGAGVRFVPAADDASIRGAVLMAKSVVALDEQRWRLTMEVAELRARLAEVERQRTTAEKRNRQLRDRLHKVEFLHAEGQRLVKDAQHVDDTEGTGVCAYCGNLWPCRTYQATLGE